MENQEQQVANSAELTQEQRVNSFAEALKRSTSQIKSDRAQEIAEITEIQSKRKIEDLTNELRILTRRQKSMLDMSPDNTYSIIKVKDFEPIEFVNKYDSIGLEIRETMIKLNNSMNSYNKLFGQTYTLLNIE